MLHLGCSEATAFASRLESDDFRPQPHSPELIRASLDFSLAEDLNEPQEKFASRLERALVERLEPSKLRVFDWRFTSRPKNPEAGASVRWGGYKAEFKIIEEQKWRECDGDLNLARRHAWRNLPQGGSSQIFKIELSKFEFCEPAVEVEVDGNSIKVYSEAMIASEKLRSLCQQMKEYQGATNSSARARDFYDIHSIVTEAGVNLNSPVNQKLLRSVFAAKDVPLELLGRVQDYREFHRENWPAARDTLPAGHAPDFDYYFDFVLQVVTRLETLWNEQSP